MDLSIVIVNWNTAALLRDCLASLPAAAAGLGTEILVVDNASSDESCSLVEREFPHATLIRAGGNLGFARANNLALARARGEAVLLLNPDTVCPPHSLTRLLTFLRRHPEVAAVGPRLIGPDERPTMSAGFFPRVRDHWLGFLDPRRLWLRGPLARRIALVPGRSDPSGPVDYVVGACLLMTRRALEQVGNLDERFFLYFEETDWCRRARDLGLEVWYCGETEIVHLEGAAAGTVSEFSARQFQHSYRLFVAKHRGKGMVFWFRLAQFAEFGAKALLRRLAPGDREANRRQAAGLWLKARLQLQGDVEPTPP